MAGSQTSTPFYIRTQEGATFFVDTMEEALEEFFSEDGYRLTLYSEGKELVIRRSSEWHLDSLGQKESNAFLTRREKS